MWLIFRERFFLILMCSFSIAINSIQGQKKEFHNLIAFRYDNDVFTFTDRYYSFGNFVEYRRKLKSDFLLKKREDDQLQLNFSLGQLGYTPDEFDEIDVGLYDYTNAGWLFLKSELFRSNKKTGISLAFEVGVTGSASFADSAQKGTHDLFNIGNEPLWIDQIPTSFLINLKPTYVLEFLSLKKGF